MDAVILAGGRGTRLRPLTYSIPKPLVPVGNIPMIMRLIEKLPEDVSRVIITSSYMVDEMKTFFSSAKSEREIIVIEETEPLGTGGAIKNVEEYLDVSFFVLNADIFSDIDMKKFHDFFISRKGIGAISLYEVEDISHYGVVEMDNKKKILKFMEKVDNSATSSRLINAGTYIFSKSILEAIPPGKNVSLEREVFPKLDSLYGFKFDGKWIDAGTSERLIELNKWITNDEGNAIGRNVTIGKGADIISSSIGDNTIIGDGAKIENSIIMENSKISNGVKIVNSIVGKSCQIEISMANSVLCERTILGRI